jgi:hypothetical protein
MELIKKTILLEDSIDRGYNSPTYGTVTATSFYINVMLLQNVDDMGMFTDIDFLPNYAGNNTPVDYSVLIEKLSTSGITFPFMSGITPSMAQTQINDIIRVTGASVSGYYNSTNSTITGQTESKAEDVRSYSSLQPYSLNFDTNTESYINYSGGTVNGVDRATSLGNPFTYVFGADVTDPNIGTINQKNGLVYQDFSGKTSNTVVSYVGEGWNETNTSLSALTKEEYLFGIISKPEVKSDVFIDRAITTIFEKHLKLSEISNLDELTRYGRGFYNIIRQ